MTCQPTSDREAIADAAPTRSAWTASSSSNTRPRKPQALGQVLETMGFRPIARHRSREVLLYRQGEMNIIVNAHASGLPRTAQPAETPGDRGDRAARARCRRARTAARSSAAPGRCRRTSRSMELNIPAIHGVGESRIYFVDRYREFSIYDVDFAPIPTVDPQPPALAGLHWFGVVQYIGDDRTRRLDRVLLASCSASGAARRRSASASCPRAACCESPCGSVLPAADRARARHRSTSTATSAAARRLRHARRAGARARAARARRRIRRVAAACTPSTRGALTAALAGRRDVRARAHDEPP